MRDHRCCREGSAERGTAVRGGQPSLSAYRALYASSILTRHSLSHSTQCSSLLLVSSTHLDLAELQVLPPPSLTVQCSAVQCSAHLFHGGELPAAALWWQRAAPDHSTAQHSTAASGHLRVSACPSAVRRCTEKLHTALQCGAVRCGAQRNYIQRCSAVRCGAVCGAVRCGVVWWAVWWAVRCGAVCRVRTTESWYADISPTVLSPYRSLRSVSTAEPSSGA
jgi:hypothetical protein